MAPTPREEGLGRRRGSSNLADALLIPKDPRGIVLACGCVALAALGVNVLFSGDSIGVAYLIGAGLGYFFLQTRLVPIVVWLLVGIWGAAGATAGNSADWVVAALGSVLVLVSTSRPVEPTPSPETSGNHEVGRQAAELRTVESSPPSGEISGNHELGEETDLTDGSRQASLEGFTTSSAVSATAPPAAASESFDPIPSAKLRVRLRTIGSFSLEVDGVDRTQRIREQPRLEFLLKYLTARTVREREGAVDRPPLAEEMAPGIAVSSQRDRLKKRLHALQSALGPDLKGLLRVNNVQVRLDLGGVEVDFIALAETSARVGRRHGLLDETLADEVRSLLEATASGEFLSGFTDLEHQVTQGRGSAGQVVADARIAIAGWRADLSAALARYLEAIGRPQGSIAYLRSALSQSPDREDLARLLLTAYMQTGQTARAEELRLEYELSRGETK
ncbi:MAG TPA: bacterial transcriptional activator domain-containing protein [Candidatus Dormibacteraeota bacterium]|jgi:hypothetical protein|nr:bacterial transcriptional activator domain-containing protein [Candidatus Dormibacteraeota bacterium]